MHSLSLCAGFVGCVFCGSVASSSFLYRLFFFLMIRRPPRSTLDRSSAASDVYKRQIFGSLVTYLIPVVAIIIGFLDGEKLFFHHLIGMLFILLGIYVLNYSGRKKIQNNEVDINKASEG